MQVGGNPGRASSRPLSVLFAWLAALTVCSSAVLAQEQAPPPRPAPTQPAAEDQAAAVSPVFGELSGKIEVVGPDTYLLLDSQGNPQPVLNMPLEEFINAWKSQQSLKQNAAAESPIFTLRRMPLDWHARGQPG